MNCETSLLDDPDRAILLGWWRLLSCEVEFQDSGSYEPMYGSPARGYLVFGENGRMIVFIAAENRTSPVTEPDHIKSHLSMAAYIGSYRADSNQWVTHVESSWNAVWDGTEQVRPFLIEDGHLHVISEWYPSPLHAGNVVRAHIVWSRSMADDPSRCRPLSGASMMRTPEVDPACQLACPAGDVHPVSDQEIAARRSEPDPALVNTLRALVEGEHGAIAAYCLALLV